MRNKFLQILPILGMACLAGCAGDPTASSTQGDSSATPSVTDTSETTPSESGPQLANVASIKLAALPNIKIGEMVDIADYLTLVMADGTELTIDEVDGAREETLVQDMGDTAEGDAMLTIDEEDPLKVSVVNVGTAKLEVNLVATPTKILDTEGELTVTASDEMVAMLETLDTIEDNFTIKMPEEGLEGARTANYYSYGTEGGVILNDGKLYRFTADGLDGGNFAVTTAIIAEDGASYMAESMPAVDIGEADLVWEPLLADLGFEYSIVAEDDVSSIMGSLGLDVLIPSGGTYYVVVELGVKAAAEGTVTLVPIMIDISMTTMAFLSDITISDIGATALEYVDDYIESGEIPQSNAGALKEKFGAIADGENYTITASGGLYETGTDTALNQADLPEQTSLGDMYTALYGDRMLQFTEDGMWYEGYSYDDWYRIFDKSEYGYMDHVDGYVCSFDMEGGKAVIGEKQTDYDYEVGECDVMAPFYDTFGINLWLVDEECLDGSNMIQDAENPNLYHYVYANDANRGTYYTDVSFGSLMLETIYGDMLSLLLDDTYGEAFIQNLTMDVLLTDDGIVVTGNVPLTFTEEFAADFRFTINVGEVGTTVIPGLADILDDTPAPSSGGWYW